MLPQREYESMRETLYLMASPANRQRVNQLIEDISRNENTG
jgi:PHD/YefM family antitoxin component YafN of YafNO toxin-antitoxin module